MTQRKRHRGGRSAFTLVELMVVITIIAILVALLTTAVMKALSKGPELQTSSEIGEMQSKLSSMASSTGVTPLPSLLHLSKLNKYTNTPLDQISKRFLQQRFGKYTCYSSSTAGYFPALPITQSINWNGDPNPDEELYLEGEQVLVFLLGGVPLTANGNTTMVGFSSNKQNPAQPPFNGEHRDGPFFEFQSNRLVPIASSSTAFPLNTGKFPVYLDPWKQVGGLAKQQPYAFFASSVQEGGGLYTSDCPSLLTAPPALPLAPATPLAPYIQSNAGGVIIFMNPSSYQIISAGKDGVFGASASWNSKTGNSDPAGKDDQSNFSAHLLGMAP